MSWLGSCALGELKWTRSRPRPNEGPEGGMKSNYTVYNQIYGKIKRLPYVWDYDLDESQFCDILEGRRTLGRLDQDWAARRLLEYAPYEEIVRLIGFSRLVRNWPRWRGRIRSESRKRGFDFLVKWLPEKHPELL